MERTCFAFKEHKHNQCECMILNELECKNGERDCPFFKYKKNVNLEKIEKEVLNYAKKKTPRMGAR